MNPKISVIIPVFNGGQYFKDCLESIGSQTFQDFELIVVNDASTDNTSFIIDESRSLFKSLKVITHQANQGISVSRNDGVKISAGDYIAFIDSDDLLSKDYLASLYNYATSNDCDLAICGYKEFSSNKTIEDLSSNDSSNAVKAVFDNDSLMRELASQERLQGFVWGRIYKSSIVKAHEFPSGKIFEDIFTSVQFFSECKKGLLFNTVEYFYRVNPSSCSRNLNVRKINDYCDALLEKSIFYKEKYSKYLFLLVPSVLSFYGDVYLNGIKPEDISNYWKLLSLYKHPRKNLKYPMKLKLFVYRHPALAKMLLKRRKSR
jgi:glycosyltransferase involved in cell wall biosynthesis